MPKTDIKIYATDNISGKKGTTTVSYVNDTADSLKLKTLGQMLNALTTNNYDSTDRVQTINVDTEEVPITPTPKTEPTLTVGNFYQGTEKSIKAQVTYDGDGILTANIDFAQSSNKVLTTQIATFIGSNLEIMIFSENQITTSTQFKLYITASETENYASKTITVTNP